jgi:hypothetical protein
MPAAAHTNLACPDPDPDAAPDMAPWSRPWMAPWRNTGPGTVGAMARGQPVWQALNDHAPAPVRFVPQAELPAGVAYERFIADSACCPVRDGWHDLLNGLCWNLFPAAKRRLNQLQATEITQNGIRPTRGPVRDAITVFDENAALLQAPDALWDALVEKKWHRVFIDLRPLWQQSRLVLFGHALLEKLLTPRKSITAHVFRIGADSAELADWDTWLAGALTAERLASRPFAHLPVLGVPGWWGPNEDPRFYNDPQVFRAPSTRPAGPPQ